MNKIDKIYYINLDRRPDRNEHFLKQCSIHKIPYNKVQRFEALDGKTYEFTNKEIDLFKNVDYRTESYSKKIMGNQLSHFYILQEMVKNNYNYIMIFQDDVIFKNNFNNYINKLINDLPDNTEIVNIAFHKFAAYNKFIPYDLNSNDSISKKKITTEVCMLVDTINPCSLGYIVTLQGAKNLIDYFLKLGFLRATDWNFNDYLLKKNIYYGSTTILATGNPDLGSDIF